MAPFRVSKLVDLLGPLVSSCEESKGIVIEDCKERPGLIKGAAVGDQKSSSVNCKSSVELDQPFLESWIPPLGEGVVIFGLSSILDFRARLSFSLSCCE